ncbi:MAG: hypothetical protein PVJ53_07360 [Desulfobacterales bacterium]|jgi:hypothetical protein
MIPFELAGNLAGAEPILAARDEPARIRAGIRLGLDFFFIAVYAFTRADAWRMPAGHLPPGGG